MLCQGAPLIGGESVFQLGAGLGSAWGASGRMLGRSRARPVFRSNRAGLLAEGPSSTVHAGLGTDGTGAYESSSCLCH